MTLSFRSGFYAGLAVAIIVGLYLAWLWQASRQVKLHNQHLLAAVEARITVEADENEITALIKERVNHLDTPFVFEWRKASGKPWDWKLTRVSNDALELPEANF